MIIFVIRNNIVIFGLYKIYKAVNKFTNKLAKFKAVVYSKVGFYVKGGYRKF